MDTIANMLSQIKNASLVKKESLELSHSKLLEAILRVIEKAGFVKKVSVFKEKDSVRKSLHIELAYNSENEPMLREARRVSKLGRRMYMPSKEIKRVNSKYGLIVMSTPKGIMTGEQARKEKLGGEVICEIK
ncbi:30S ribosomal protein S8 [candidate division WWE3 bacterium]|nr:30S ribosomal protein S8 [candidate division WWE3 bacterium]